MGGCVYGYIKEIGGLKLTLCGRFNAEADYHSHFLSSPSLPGFVCTNSDTGIHTATHMLLQVTTHRADTADIHKHTQ